MPKKKVELTFVADFAAPLNGREIVSVNVGPKNEVLLLATTSTVKKQALGRDVQPGWASFPKSKVAPYRADVLKFTPEFQGEVPIEIEEAHPFVQPLPNGESLVVAARCHNRDGNPEFNAAVYEQDGTFARRFLLGDGLKHVAVARDGTIWTGYSDEGIFGNFGWGANSENEQKAPIGASGIARFNVQGDILWQCKLNSMADCYTLNVADDGVWSCPYTDFPIVCIKPDGSQQMWRNEMTGARGLIVDNHRVLLFGGYTENRSRCVIQDLGEDAMQNAREIELVLPSGDPIAKARVLNRNSTLHLFLNTCWYQLDLAQHDI